MVIKRKLFTKAWMPGGRKDVSELNDKQLDNIIKWETPKSQSNVKKNSAKIVGGMTVVPAAAGYAVGKLLKDPQATLKNAGKTAAVCGTLGAAIAGGGYVHHKRLVKKAKGEKEKRKNDSLKG